MSAFRACVVVALFIVAIGPSDAAATEDAAIGEANRLLYTNRQHALMLLEEAADRSPRDVNVWAELIHALEVDSANAFAERASRKALRLNPDDPALLLARARILRAGPALDVLTKLGHLPGHEQEAADLAEQVSLDISIPHIHQQLTPYVLWASRLVTAGRVERAMEVADAGLKTDLKPETREQLQAIRGVCLALLGRYVECLDAQRAAKGLQYLIPGGWTGAADVLLSKGEPTLAIRSFAGRMPRPAPRDPEAATSDSDEGARRRVMAMAQARTGKIAEAVAILAGDEPFDQLLLLRVHVLAGNEDKAKQVAAKLLAVYPNDSAGGSYGGPLVQDVYGQVSLEGDYAAALRWLAERFPDRARGIDRFLGGPDDRPNRSPGFSYGIRPSSQVIPIIRASLAYAEEKGDANAARDLRSRLTSVYESAGLFAEAARCIAPLAIDPTSQLAAQPFNYFALQWSVLRRRVTTESFFQTAPKTLASSRVLLASSNGQRWSRPPTTGQALPSDDERVAFLTKMGPGVLAPVMDALGPNMIFSDDRTVFVRAISALGDEGDAPLLIGVLARLNEHAPQNPTVAAVREALHRLTKVRPPLAQDEIGFWNAWWRANAVRIVNGERTK